MVIAGLEGQFSEMMENSMILGGDHRGVYITGISDGKQSACRAGDPGFIPESGRSPGEENGYSLQYSCLENPME